MTKKKSHLQMILEKHKNIPLPEEYKSVFFSYIKLFHKWMHHINRALDNEIECNQMATTASAMQKCNEMQDLIGEVCWMRDGILVCISLITYIGMTVPSKTTLENFKQIYNIIDDSILTYMALIQRYNRAIKNHTKLTLKGLKRPISFGDIQRMKIWPRQEVMDACFVNGQLIMGIQTTVKKG